ncbi:MAG TPA: DUF4388 domain-containing protein, partial [Candidatus Polarisedimenticolaceae bacterium]|nr:DUF4388 domain-containing protein [Candidatus Polarisedimenticolaceae bacterium]
MDPSTHEGIPPGLLAGHLEGICIADLLWALCRRQLTGLLRIDRSDLTRTVFIQDGSIVFASSSDPEDRLGERFLRQGVIRLEQLETALARLSSGKRLGTLLVEDGAISSSTLVEGVVAQVKAIVLDLFRHDEGEYRFEPGPLPSDEVIKLQMRTGDILLQGIRSIRSFQRIRGRVGPPRTTFALTGDWSRHLDGVALTHGEELLIERLKHGAESVERLCHEVFLSNFEIYQTLWALQVIGAVEPRDPAGARAEGAAHDGRLADEGFPEVLVRLCQENETGVLHVSRGTIERTFHLTHGRCVFATSSDPDDSLLSYLLRRGVISLRDREETAKRLLSNKRVGTILRELGVIDERDLRDMVRQQISEIVFDTFRWEDGDYYFVPGPLPTMEEIALEDRLESLVSAGIKRVSAWTRVRRGCGGLDGPLRLTPRYLDVLDAMSGGAEEFELTAQLKQPHSARQACIQSMLGSFRLCQTLWALRILGAVEALPPGATVEAEMPAVAAAPPSPEATQVLSRE